MQGLQDLNHLIWTSSFVSFYFTWYETVEFHLKHEENVDVLSCTLLPNKIFFELIYLIWRSDISNRARVLLSRWSKIFARSQAMKRPNAMKSFADGARKVITINHRQAHILMSSASTICLFDFSLSHCCHVQCWWNSWWWTMAVKRRRICEFITVRNKCFSIILRLLIFCSILFIFWNTGRNASVRLWKFWEC